MVDGVAKRVKRRRDAPRELGLRPVQIWAPDTCAPRFAEECRRQSLAVSEAGRNDPELFALLDAAMAEMDASRGAQ
jgi:hypothetical protein